MDSKIKKLLIELTLNGKKPFKYEILAKADEKLGISDSVTLTNLLMQWHKKIKQGVPFAQYQNDYLQLSDVSLPKYKIFFDNCPELSKLYELKASKIYFNSFLSQEEKQEILDYVNEHYKIVRHSYGKKE
ncbi:hypothetical protein [Chryseobacterium sp. G0201]|uniref:hypothetical protein n=1 Tax=Chryseobacterium sp. G0201 TaxID=2487065 RepID=UPI000F4F620B|nr:hypothetical protein [Chryseobacterium sp. G0201]AZA52915.1 hypothetical protein EG348_07780 [Chryseobacterium sp. G0201]